MGKTKEYFIEQMERADNKDIKDDLFFDEEYHYEESKRRKAASVDISVFFKYLNSILIKSDEKGHIQ
jgi:hypothetical protein